MNKKIVFLSNERLDFRRANTKDFAEILKAFVKNTNEKEQIVKAVQEQIEQLNKGVFTDIGCGQGAVTLPLSSSFAKTFALDLNQANLASIKRQKALIETRAGDINFLFPEHNSDLILFSFILGYLGAAELSEVERAGYQMEIFKRWHASLASGGKSIIIGSAPHSAEYQRIFASTGKEALAELSLLMLKLRELPKVIVKDFISEVVTETLEEMILAIRLIIYEIHQTSQDTFQKIVDFARTLKNAQTGKYTLVLRNELLVVPDK